MKAPKRSLLVLAAVLALALGSAAQHAASQPKHPDEKAAGAHRQSAQPSRDETGARKGEPAAAGADSSQEQLAHASREAAGEEEEENAQFKQSKVVRAIAAATGLTPKGAYWVLYSLDFAIIAALIVWFWKSNLPAAFRARTQTIRKGMEEARQASDEARRRLSDIEGRLARLDSEIAKLRAAAEVEAAAEEQRIRAAADEEARKIMQSAETEIDAAAKAARRELKAYAAELAVGLAEKRIHIDPGTDQALVRSFVAQLAQSENHDSGKGKR